MITDKDPRSPLERINDGRMVVRGFVIGVAFSAATAAIILGLLT